MQYCLFVHRHRWKLVLPLKLTWKRGTDLPYGMYGYPQVVVLGENLYIGGGLASSDSKAQTVVIYDPKKDSFDTLLTYPCKWFSMTAVNNQLVLVGGKDMQTGIRTNVLGVWNEQSKRITHPLPPMNIACNSPSVTNHKNRWLVVMGGIGNETILSRVEVLDTTESRQWYQAAALPKACAQILPATISNMCYLLHWVAIQRDVFHPIKYSVCVWMSSSPKLFPKKLA